MLRLRRSAGVLALVVALELGGLGVAGAMAQDPSSPATADPRGLPSRVVDLAPRVVDLAPRVVDLAPKRQQDGAIAVNTDVLFAFGSATLSPDASSVLAGLVAKVKAAKGRTVTITGYTDSIGEDAFNLDLSRKRAASVQQFLASKAPGVMLRSTGKGEADPVAPNTDGSADNPDGRRLNRRVTISIR
ncbi:MAG: OmpA family protein [Mycobacteriales bacterium]